MPCLPSPLINTSHRHIPVKRNNEHVIHTPLNTTGWFTLVCTFKRKNIKIQNFTNLRNYHYMLIYDVEITTEISTTVKPFQGHRLPVKGSEDSIRHETRQIKMVWPFSVKGTG